MHPSAAAACCSLKGCSLQIRKFHLGAVLVMCTLSTDPAISCECDSVTAHQGQAFLSAACEYTTCVKPACSWKGPSSCTLCWLFKAHVCNRAQCTVHYCVTDLLVQAFKRCYECCQNMSTAMQTFRISTTADWSHTCVDGSRRRPCFPSSTSAST